MIRKNYEMPIAEVEESLFPGLVCQSLLDDLEDGSLEFEGSDGFDPSAVGDDFTWGN